MINKARGLYFSVASMCYASRKISNGETEFKMNINALDFYNNTQKLSVST